MNYGHMHSCTSSSVAANLLPRDLGRPAIFLLGRAPFAQQKNSKKQLLIANETADSPEHISIIHFINSTHVKWILEPSDVYYPMAYSLLFSCFLYWSWFFLNWICLVMWFCLNLEDISSCSVSDSSGKDAVVWEKIKSMSETSVDFPHLEFPRFHQTVLCWAASLEYPSQCLAGWSLFSHGSAPSCGMCNGFLANTTQMLQSAHCSKRGPGLAGFSYSAVLNASHKLKEL